MSKKQKLYALYSDYTDEFCTPLLYENELKDYIEKTFGKTE